ncbi:MAG: permease [Candidatus Cloacimonetes bacterium]|nr:permease [Candidatus Cloacimonadota bacterium]
MTRKLALQAFAVVAVVALFYFLPVGAARFDNAVLEALHLTRDYAREHVLLCLVPAFLIAGAISVFISQGAMMRYLGAQAPKALAYAVASVSGSVLAVCSCTVLPLFAGIYRMGAGLGPATAFLYAGPAVNVLAIVLTARVLGPEFGLARAVGAVTFSVVIGLAMHLLFRHEEQDKIAMQIPRAESPRPLWQNAAMLAAMVGVLVFANWAPPRDDGSLWQVVYAAKWWLAGGFAALLGVCASMFLGVRWWKLALTAVAVAVVAILLPGVPEAGFSLGVAGLVLASLTSRREESREWMRSTWEYVLLILPLLLGGVLVAGLLLGRPGHEGLIPSRWVAMMVGGNGLGANLFASVAGALMYFATLTEIPILQGLLGGGMGKGPALALLLAGPALSLPNMLVIRSVLGIRKTMAFVLLVVSMATLSGMLFGWIVN